MICWSYSFRQSRATPKPGRSSGSSSWSNEASPKRVLHDRSIWVKGAKSSANRGVIAFQFESNSHDLDLGNRVWERLGKKRRRRGVGKPEEEEFTHVTESKSILKQCFYSRSVFLPCVCGVCKKQTRQFYNLQTTTSIEPRAVLAVKRFKLIKIHAYSHY